MRSELVGILFPNDSLLHTNEPLEVNPGLNIVYGLNGAGKSRLLRGVTNVLRGIESDIAVALVVRIQTSAGLPTSSQQKETRAQVSAFGREPAQAVAAARATARDFEWEMREFAEPADQRRIKPSVVQRLLDTTKWERLGAATPLAKEIAADSLFLFAPTGTSSAPSWDVWPVADTRLPLTGSASAMLDDLAEIAYPLENAGAESDEDPVEVLEEATRESPLFAPLFSEVWSSGAARHLLQPSPFIAYSIGDLQADQVEPVRVIGRVDFGVDLIEPDLNVNAATREHLAVLHAALTSALAADEETPLRSALGTAGSNLLSPAFRARALSPTQPQSDWSAILFERELDDDDVARFIETMKVEIASVLDELVADLEARVNAELRAILLDAPTAKLQLARSDQPFAPEPVYWTFGPRSLPIEALSTAEARWATRIISEAVTGQLREFALGVDHERTLLNVIDEPEAALHRAAEAHMATAMRRRATNRTVMLVATHSPDLLDAPDGHLTEVKKNATHFGRSLVQRLDLSDRAALDELGLAPSDLLRWPRVILLVEGEHDAVLLDAFLGPRLRDARVKVVPLHGGAKLPHTVDSQVLFDHTDAHVVALLDNLRAERLSEVWQRATELAIGGDLESAKAAVLAGLPTDRKKKGDEANYMRAWLTRALDAGLASRATPFALGEVDVIRYLPVSFFVPKAVNWAALDEAHQKERADTSRKTPVPSDFKDWLKTRHKVSMTPAMLREAAAATDLPRDFEMLMKTIEALSSEVR